jgi:hypothetical protein
MLLATCERVATCDCSLLFLFLFLFFYLKERMNETRHTYQKMLNGAVQKQRQ